MVAVGLPMAVAYVCQAAGMKEIDSSKSAFIAALHVPLVPILQLALMSVAPPGSTWLGVALCLLGLLLLAGPGALVASLASGEFLTVVSTVAIALEIVMIGLFAPRVNVQAASVLQLVFVAASALVAAALWGDGVPRRLPAGFWPLVAALGIAIAAMQVLMNWAQQTVSPTRATLIYAMEPVWAGAIGWFAGERLGIVAWAGCGLIILGVLASEWHPRERS